MSDPVCYVIAPGELTDAFKAVLSLPLTVVVAYVVFSEWEGFWSRVRLFRRRRRLRAIREARTHA